MLCEDVVATLAIVCDRDRRSLDDGVCGGQAICFGG